MRISPFALIKRFAREDRGASFVEYALLVSLIVTAAAGVTAAFFTDIENAFDNIGDTITTATGGTP